MILKIIGGTSMAVDLKSSKANLKVSVDEVISVKVVVILTEGIEQSLGDLILSSSVNLLQYWMYYQKYLFVNTLSHPI